jgi:hypothetical protein
MKWTVALGLLLAAIGLHAQDVVARAMQDELQRSLKKLKLEQLDRPYFISYKVTDIDAKDVSASFGSLLSSSESRSRMLTVEVRVGDYALDNTNFFSMSMGGAGVVRMFGGMVQMPLDDNYDELRRQLWLATDGAYKKALEDLSGKRAALQNKNRTDNVPDFSKEKPLTVSDLAPAAEIDLREAERLTKKLSSLFRQIPAVEDSHVRLAAASTLERFLNSEGSSFTRRVPFVSLTASAFAQAADGLPLNDFIAVYGRSIKDFPSEASLTSEVRALGERIGKLQAAPVEDRYNGPVLFEEEAAAELIAQVFARQLPAAPGMITDNPQFERALAGRGESKLLDKIEARVLPDFLSVVDNPTATQAEDHPLWGGYKVDEEGTAARLTPVVENGVLKTVLTSRAPVRGVLQSTGNRRPQGAAPSNLIVTSQKASSPQEIRNQFMDLVKRRGKAYGIVVRRLGDPAFRANGDPFAAMMAAQSGQEEKLEPAILAYRVYPDGHEELIRNANFSGVSLASLKDILSVSSTRTVYTAPFAARGGSPFGFSSSPAQTVVSYVVPSILLLEDVGIQKPSGEIPKPPASGHPFFAK